MRIAIMTDLEGVAGVRNFDDWCNPDSRYYETGKRFLTQEVNAAIRGFCDAGATEIVVIDGHGHGAIDIEFLDERAELSRGWGVYHQFGLNDNFDAMAFVGQHAKAGTVKSHLTHTGMPDTYDLHINGISVGEYGECTMIGGFYGTPVIFASGERALCEEAKALTPWVHTAETKYGVTLDNGAHCDDGEYWVHNLGAVHVHPNVARARIYEAAKAALEDMKNNPDKFKPFCPEAPFVREHWIRKIGNARPFKLVQRHDTDLVALYSEPEERYPEGTYELPY